MPSVSYSATTSRTLTCDLATSRPCCWTWAGRIGIADCSLFCTWTWAMSGLVPAAKVAVMTDWPFELLVDEKYSRWSRPLSCCSMTWVTALAMVSAEAPG